MPRLDTSREVGRWFTSVLQAERQRETKHGTLYYRLCPVCGQRCRVLVPRDKDPISPGVLSSICRSAHVSERGEARCPNRDR